MTTASDPSLARDAQHSSLADGRAIPRVRGIEHGVAFLADPYRFIGRRCRLAASDVIEARLLLTRTICMTGPDAARLFYDPAHFERHGAVPAPLRAALIGNGGVHGLDGAAHRHRKALFIEWLAPDRVGRLSRLVAEEWQRAAARWPGGGRVTLYAEAQLVLMRAVCAWAGVPLAESELGLRTGQVVSQFDDAATLSPRQWRARWRRAQAERWLATLIDAVRSAPPPALAGSLGERIAGASSPLETVAMRSDAQGEWLPAATAAVELLNLIRPCVGIAVYIVHAARLLHAHPECRAPLLRGESGAMNCFVREVRRDAPFIPVVAARVRQSFVWRGLRFPEGMRVLLDLYGTNHDERVWDAPDAFQPQRFRQGAPGPFDFIPQGSADAERHHRCPGEDITEVVMKTSLRFLLGHVDYRVPAQDMRLDMARIPALPRDGFVMQLGRAGPAPASTVGRP